MQKFNLERGVKTFEQSCSYKLRCRVDRWLTENKKYRCGCDKIQPLNMNS